MTRSTRWRGPDIPDAMDTNEDGLAVVHLSAKVLKVDHGETGNVTVPLELLEQLLELAGYARLDDQEDPHD